MKKLNKTQRLIKVIRDNIAWGVYQPEQPIESVREMARQAQVSTYTVAQAYEQLVASGELRAVKGVGYFINFPADEQYPSAIANGQIANPTVIQSQLESDWLEMQMENNLPLERSPGSSQLPKEWLVDGLLLERASHRAIAHFSQFGAESEQPQGCLQFRQIFCDHLAKEHILAEPAQVITTATITQGLYILMSGYCQHGDSILVDDPGCFWTIAAARQLGLNVVGIPRIKDGIDLQAFEQSLKTHQPKLYCTASRNHDPTGYSYSMQHLHKVLALLHQFNQEKEAQSKCYLVETDRNSEIVTADNGLRFASLDGFEQVVYCADMGQALANCCQVGIMVCPKQLLPNLFWQQRLTGMMGSRLNEQIMLEVWQDTAYKECLAKLITQMHLAHQQLLSWLIALGFIDGSIDVYPTGRFIWLDVGVDTTTLAMKARQANWQLVPGSLFSVNGQYKTFLRLNVATTSKAFLLWLRNCIDQLKTIRGK